MSEAKFTPGPWKASERTPAVVVTDRAIPKAGESPVTYKRICNCDNPNYMTAEEVAANASLIAAAPTLLAYAQLEAAYQEIAEGSQERIEELFAKHGYRSLEEDGLRALWLAKFRRSALAAAGVTV